MENRDTTLYRILEKAQLKGSKMVQGSIQINEDTFQKYRGLDSKGLQ